VAFAFALLASLMLAGSVGIDLAAGHGAHKKSKKRRYDVTYTGTQKQEVQKSCPDGVTSYTEHSTNTTTWNLSSTKGQRIVASRRGADANVIAEEMDGDATQDTVFESSLPGHSFTDTQTGADLVVGLLNSSDFVTDNKHALAAVSVDYPEFGSLDEAIPIPMKLKHLKRSYTLKVEGTAPGPDIDIDCTGTSTRSINATWDVTQVSGH
jgi:hypothetical protein